jgi:Kdo-III transferase WaaZ
MASIGTTPDGRRRQKPLRRQLIRLVLAGVRGWSHAHNWLPSLRLTRDDAGRFFQALFHGREVAVLNPATLLSAEMSGTELFVVGSGPSVSTTPLHPVGPRSAILLNGACTLIGQRIEDPLAIAVEDERFVWRHFDLLKEKTRPGTIALLSTGVIRAICEIDAGWLRNVRVVLIDDIRKPYSKVQRSYESLRHLSAAVVNEAGDAGFSTDPDQGVFQGGSVAISAIQFASSCRPATISLIGIDIANADQPRFYEQAGQAAPSGIHRSQDRIVKHVALARDVCREQGTLLRSLSPISLLNKVL